jgi:hypothetical protein
MGEKMSRSSFLASSLEAEFKVLAPVNDAMINLKLHKFGRAGDLAINTEDIRKSKEILSNFLNEIIIWLNEKRGNAAFYFVFRILQTGRKSPDEWKESLLKLIKSLQSNTEITYYDIELLEDLLSQIGERINSEMAKLRAM